MLEEGLNCVPVAGFDTTLLKMMDPESARVLNVKKNVPVYLASINLGMKSPWKSKISHVVLDSRELVMCDIGIL